MLSPDGQFSSVADPELYFFGPYGSDPLVRGTDPDIFIIKQNSKKYLDSYGF